ncbi:hypothetical protein C0995_011763 [Termitomyces sp. Mi166|nr:hypothetical protein C0995_011763 [Termitomyces sp. Mi166\
MFHFNNADKEDTPPIRLTTEEPQELWDNNQTLTDNMILRSAKAQLKEQQLEKVKEWLTNTKWPISRGDKEYVKFIQYAMNFFSNNSHLWQWDCAGAHKLVAKPSSQLKILTQMHNGLGHKGLYAI